MKKEIIKKVLVAVVVLLFLSTAFVTAVPNVKITEEKNIVEKTGSGSFDEESELVTFAFELTTANNYQSENYGGWSCSNNGGGISRATVYEIQLTKYEADCLTDKIELLDKKLSTTDDHMERVKLVEQKLSILKDYGVLPSEFTLENLGELVMEIGEAFISPLHKKISLHSTNFEAPPSIKWIPGRPFIGIGPTIFAYVSPLGTTYPFGFSPAGLRAIGLPPSIINAKLNSSGIFINCSNCYILQSQEIIIDSPFWKSIWNISGNDSWINVTEIHAAGYYHAELLIGHSVNFGFVWSLFPNPFKVRFLAGSFYYVGAPTIPISFTLYKTYPAPWTVLLDVGIIISGSAVIIPFWFEDPFFTGDLLDGS